MLILVKDLPKDALSYTKNILVNEYGAVMCSEHAEGQLFTVQSVYLKDALRLPGVHHCPRKWMKFQ